MKSWSLIKPTAPVEYCALSHIWCGVGMFKATAANAHSLQGEEAKLPWIKIDSKYYDVKYSALKHV